MATDQTIDAGLVQQARQLGHHDDDAAAVNEALREYVKRRKQLGILALEGTIDYDPDYDYKALRRKESPC